MNEELRNPFNIKESTLNNLVVGAGLIGQERIAALLNISLNFKIKIDITVVDKNENQLKAIQEKYDLNISTEIEENV